MIHATYLQLLCHFPSFEMLQSLAVHLLLCCRIWAVGFNTRAYGEVSCVWRRDASKQCTHDSQYVGNRCSSKTLASKHTDPLAVLRGKVQYR